jgi:hypothetical protein
MIESAVIGMAGNEGDLGRFIEERLKEILESAKPFLTVAEEEDIREMLKDPERSIIVIDERDLDLMLEDETELSGISA